MTRGSERGTNCSLKGVLRQLPLKLKGKQVILEGCVTGVNRGWQGGGVWLRFTTNTDQTDEYRQILTCQGFSEFVGDIRYMLPPRPGC